MGDGTLILLDTHAVVWTLEGSPRLSKRAALAISQSRRDGALCAAGITLLEVARLLAKKRLESDLTLDSLLQAIEAAFIMLPITAAVAAATTRLPETYPRDPADRIIGATALVHGATLITADQRIRKAKAVRTLW